MLSISRRILRYICVLTGKAMSHYILIGQSGSSMVMLSHANIYLRYLSSSLDTSNRYSNVISMFYRYLAGVDKFKSVPLGSYLSLVDNQDIKNWQISRQAIRVANQSARPSTETIVEDGKLIYGFLQWLDSQGYESCVKFEYKTWMPNFKDESLLAHIKKQALQILDGKGVQVLDRELRQNKSYSLPTDYELQSLIASYHDPVYAAMFKLSLGTAMRPIDLCRFPYLGSGANSHLMPYENMEFKEETTSYFIFTSKGNKNRTVKVHRLDLKALYDHYIKDHYARRADLYARRYGRPCPPSILFLSSRGIPVTPKMISRRTVDARKIARLKDPSIRPEIRFYDSRHWWPTMFLIKRFKSALLGELSEVRDAAAMQVLKDQMGHVHLTTTYDHYIDVARIVLGAHQGLVNELATNPSQSVSQFLKSPSLD